MRPRRPSRAWLVTHPKDWAAAGGGRGGTLGPKNSFRHVHAVVESGDVCRSLAKIRAQMLIKHSIKLKKYRQHQFPLSHRNLWCAVLPAPSCLDSSLERLNPCRGCWEGAWILHGASCRSGEQPSFPAAARRGFPGHPATRA